MKTTLPAHWQARIEGQVAEVLDSLTGLSGVKFRAAVAMACPFVEKSNLWRAWSLCLRREKQERELAALRAAVDAGTDIAAP